MTDQVIPTKEETQQTIFTEPQKVTPDQGEKQVTPDYNAVFKDKLSAIVDDKGEPKYNDVITALEALKHSQEYIATLQRENKMFRETQLQEKTLEEALQSINAKKEPEKTTSEGFDASKLKGMTLEAIKEYEQAKQREANAKAVSDKLVEKYGDIEKAKKAFADKANDLGVDIDTLVELSAKSPKAILAYFDTGSSQSPTTTKGSINTQAIQPTKKETVDPSSRFYNSSNPSISKWREAGQNLTI